MSGRVVVVGRGAPERGGIPSYLAMMERHRDRLGVPVVILNLTPSRPGEGGKATPANLSRTLGDARRVLRSARRGDIVHIHSALAPAVTAGRAGLLLLAARLRGAGTVLHAHGGRLAQQPPQGPARVLTSLVVRSATRVVAVAEVVREVLTTLGVDPSRLQVVPNGVAVEKYAPVAAGAAVTDGGAHVVPRVLYAGILSRRKGVLDLLEASQRLQAREVAHELWLAGGLPDEGRSAYDEVLRAVPAGVRLLGALPPGAMPATYAACDVFCLPSWWEAMPLTVLEAQAAGLPVVATDVGDVSRIVVHGETGLVVPPRDVDALEAALESLLLSAPSRSAMGARAREHAARFDERATVDLLGRVFRDIWGHP